LLRPYFVVSSSDSHLLNTYDPDKHHRRSIRLPGYDYSQPGAYFVTICIKDRMHIFGEVLDNEVRLSEGGMIALECWGRIPEHFGPVSLDVSVVMPNHIHGIVVIEPVEPVGATHASPLQNMAPYHTSTNIVSSPSATHASPLPHNGPRGPKNQSIAAIVGSFKSAVSKRINELLGTPGATVWQRNYYEHIIRDEESLNQIRQYILDNPAAWATDPENVISA
jgi:REP element-mobilizing transposase RayT